MDTLIAWLSTHNIVLMLVIAVAVMIAYFIFKRLIKLALLCSLAALGVAGYFYLKQPGRTWKDVDEAWRKTRTSTVKVVETGRKTYEKGKDVYEKGMKFSDSLDSLMGKESGKQSE